MNCSFIGGEFGSETPKSISHGTQLKGVACGILAAWAVTTASPVVAANLVRNISSFDAFILYNLVSIQFIRRNCVYLYEIRRLGGQMGQSYDF